MFCTAGDSKVKLSLGKSN